MIALAYILLISLTVLGAIRMLLPRDLKPLLGPREFAAALRELLIPLLAIFVALVIGAIIIWFAAPPERGSRIGTV